MKKLNTLLLVALVLGTLFPNFLFAVTNPTTFDSSKTNSLSSSYLFALAGQTDSEGPINFDLYASFNRVIANTSRSGTGLEKAVITFYPFNGSEAKVCAYDLKANTNDCNYPEYISTVPSILGRLELANHQAVVKLNFASSTNTLEKIKFDLYYATSTNPAGYTFTVGDSITDDGWGGDAGTQSNDAEVQIYNTTLDAYGNDQASVDGVNRNIVHLSDKIHQGDHVTLTVKNNYLGWEINSLPTTTSSEFSYNLSTDWKFISPVMQEMIGQPIINYFPNLENVYYYDGSYKTATNFEINKGYWLKNKTNEKIKVSGAPIESVNYILTGAGQHLIGAPFTMSLEGVSCIGDVLHYVSQTGTYISNMTIEQGSAAFVKTNGDCAFTVPSITTISKPDLIVKEIKEDAVNNSINVVIKNIGNVSTSIINSIVGVKYYVNTVLEYNASIYAGFLGKEQLAVNEEYSILFNKSHYLLDDIDFQSGIMYTINAEVDTNNNVSESNEINNSLKKTITVPLDDQELLPDLVIREVSYGLDTKLGKENNVTLGLVIENKGDVAVNENFYIYAVGEKPTTLNLVTPNTNKENGSYFTTEGEKKELVNVNIPAGGSQIFSEIFKLIVPVGNQLEQMVNFQLDVAPPLVSGKLPYGLIKEKDENNNSSKKQVCIYTDEEFPNNTRCKKIPVVEPVDTDKLKQLLKTEKLQNETKQIKDNAKLLFEGNINAILSDMKVLRNQVKEQEMEIKYLKNINKDLSKLNESMKDKLNQFMAYGVDDNTQKLGEGERAAVIYSFQKAYGNLPQTEDELSDVIKIANGRWPSMKNKATEDQATAKFKEIYKRDPNLNNPNDNAAIVVMAYGLRQKADNRKLVSEQQGLKIFNDLFGKAPASTEEWNVLQAITYSGATREAIDTDGDGLSDAMEAKLGTDPKKADTDGDGYIDGQEVVNNYSPLGI